MRKPAWLDPALAGELACLLLAAPALYFPNWFPVWAPWVALALLAGGWGWRRWQLGHWWVRTPADWPLFFLVGVMLPVAVWAAPDVLRARYANPRALILLWNFALFSLVVTHGSRRVALWRGMAATLLAAGTALALLAPLGMQWPAKLPGLGAALQQLPTPLAGVFRGAENGFSANQVAGALLYVLPLAVVVVAASFGRSRRRLLWWLAAGGTAAMAGVLVATQSRSGLLGLATGLAVGGLLPWRWGRWVLAAGGLVGGLVLLFQFDRILALTDTVVAENGAAQVGTLLWRGDVWVRAIAAAQDFRFTGMGLGTFREALDLNPPFLTGPHYDVAHAHNFFLQQALDFGLPGLVALLAIYLGVAGQLVALWRVPASAGTAPFVPWRIWAVGFAATLVAQTVYSLTDAVTMGAKPNFLFWYLLALILSCANLAMVQGAGNGADAQSVAEAQ